MPNPNQSGCTEAEEGGPPTCGSLWPLESESEVSRYWELVISTSVEARLRFFRGLQESEISLAPGEG